MEKQVKIILVVGFILTILLIFFFPKPVGGFSTAECGETDEGEPLICGHRRWCDCLGFEGNDNFLFITVGGGTSDICFGWPVNCNY